MRWPFRRWLLVGFLVALLALLVYAFLPSPVPVNVAAVTRGAMQVTIDEDGKTRIKEKYVISAPLAGRLLRIQLKAGDNAAANQTLLATIEPRDPELLDARARAEAEARASAAEVALAQAGPNVEKARAMMEMAKKDADHQRELAARSATARKALDDAELLERVRTQEYNAAKFQGEIAKFELQQARAALLRTRPGEPNGTPNGAPGSAPDVGHFEIRAPCNGRVLRVFQESSAVVSAGTPLLEFGDPSDLEIEIDVLSTDAVKIQRGAAVIIEGWGGDKPLRGAVRVIEPAAFTKVSALGVEEQRVNIIADFVDPPQARAALGDAYRVEARIVIWSGDDVPRVPTAALFRDNGEWAVFVVQQNAARLRRVRIGMQTALLAQVLEGLNVDEEVILHPSDKVSEGVRVHRW